MSSELAGLALQSRAPDPLVGSAPSVTTAPTPAPATQQTPGFTTDIRMVEKPAPFMGDKADSAALGAFFSSVK